MMLKTNILKIKGDWSEVVDDCRSTVGKETLGKEPSDNFKYKILLAEHSPIRDISVKWKWIDIKSWVATHWVRHKWECFVKSQRSDRTGIDRDKLPQDAPVDFTGEANIQSLIDTMRKRLCFQASPETRAYAEDLKCAIDELDPQIAWALVPNCVYRGGCPEMKGCRYWNKLVQDTEGWIRTDNVRYRYTLYNNVFRKDGGHGTLRCEVKDS